MPFICSDWFVEAVGDVVVGRYFESPQSDQSIWFAGDFLLRALLGIKTLLIFLNFFMMKNTWMICLVLITLLAGCNKEKPAEEKKVVLNAKPSAVNNMPSFAITQLDGQKVVFKQLTGKVMIVFFNPGCEHCQREAQLIASNKEVFANHQVYFITPEPASEVEKFANDYKLISEPNIHFGRGDVGEIVRAVGQVTTVPTILIYDKQDLVARMEGEISLDKMKQMLN
jgi:thiol-disulfide isomerase/thioredoxin